MSKNYEAYLKLDTSKYKTGNYIIMVNGKVEQSVSPSKLPGTMDRVRAKYPRKMPFLAKVMPSGMMCTTPF